MQFHSITYKLLATIIGGLVAAMLVILLLADIQLKHFSDDSQEALYTERLDTIEDYLKRSNERLEKTGLVNVYIEDFQLNALEFLRKSHFTDSGSGIFPFIIDTKGTVILNPQQAGADRSMTDAQLRKKMIDSGNGHFEAVYEEQATWYRYRSFEEWGWLLLYRVPHTIKYRDAAVFRKMLIISVTGVTLIVLLVLALLIRRFTRPITQLTDASKQIAAGNLDHTIDISSRDEVGILARSFDDMRTAVKGQISELKAERNRSENILKGTNAGTWDWNVQTGAMKLNRRWVEIMGKELKDLEPATIQTWRDCVHPDDLEAVNLVLQNHLDGDTDYYDVEFRQPHMNGSWVWVNARGKVVERDGDGKPLRMTGTHLDITDRRRSEEARHKLEGQLRQAQKMEAIGTLVGGIAHDFNNILSSVFGFTELALMQTAKNEPVRKHLDHVLSSAERAKELVAHLLTFSRKAEVDRQVLKIAPLLKETIKFSKATAPSTVSITYTINNQETCLLADATQMHQVFMNLFTNAVHAMKDRGGSLNITVDNVALQAGGALQAKNLTPGDYVLITVSDTGCGIPKEMIDKIYDPFFTTKRKGEGTGLGLSVTYGIIQEMGGHISVYSEENVGTTFTIFLPEIPEVTATGHTVNSADLKEGSETILLVDDESDIIEWMSDLLSHLGYTIIADSDPVHALATFHAAPNRFDLVITDLTMPHLTGTDLTEAIHRVRPNLPVILCTGFSEGLTEETLERVGITKLLMKPVISGKLSAAIEECLGNPVKSNELS